MPDDASLSERDWQVLAWLWDKKDEIADRLSKLWSWFRSGSGTTENPGILIIGAGGTGKTTLGRLLSGQYDLFLSSVGKYEESIDIERFSLTDDPDTEIVVPPGQQHRREFSWADLHGDIAGGKFRGIILVGANGYHALGISYKDHRLYKGDKDEFLQAFLEDRRADELAVLRQLTPHLEANRSKLWMMTLVTKQDLWWPENAQVEKDYRDGEYGSQVQKILDHQGRRQFRHELVLASLVISNFKTILGERLQPNCAGFDQWQQVISLRRLFETLSAFKRWEEGE